MKSIEMCGDKNSLYQSHRFGSKKPIRVEMDANKDTKKLGFLKLISIILDRVPAVRINPDDIIGISPLNVP